MIAVWLNLGSQPGYRLNVGGNKIAALVKILSTMPGPLDVFKSVLYLACETGIVTG